MVHPNSGKTEMFFDVGAYGEPHTDNFNNVNTIRRLEKATKDLNGFGLTDDYHISLFKSF